MSLISKETIDKVNDLLVFEVISKYVELKKKASGYTCLSPFVDEKSPSFSVSPSKNIWKCFSSGKGGNGGVSFVMALKNMEWKDAVKEVADQFDILIEYTDPDKAKSYLEVEQRKSILNDINAFALEYFESHISAIPEEHKRMNETTREQMAVGFAPKSYDGLLKFLKQHGYSEKQIIDASLASKNEKGKVYDFFQNRVIFPIYNEKSKLTGFSGKTIDVPKDGQKIVKYMNSRETDAFHKSELILGFHKAKEWIRKWDFGVKVEGNYDVAACWENGLPNTGAPLGSAFTLDQVLLYKKYSKNIVLFVDNDKAGISKIEKDTMLCLENEMHVRVYIPKEEGHDPFDCITATKGSDFRPSLESYAEDAVQYLAKIYFAKEEMSIVEQAAAEKKLSELLSLVSDVKLRNAYVKSLSKDYGVQKATIEADVKVTIAEKKKAEEDKNGKYRLPNYLSTEDLEDWRRFGFYEDRKLGKTGYYFPKAGDSFKQLTNFYIVPFFQIQDLKESERIIEVNNGKSKKLIQMPNKAWSSVNIFEEILTNVGDFRWDASKEELKLIRRKLFPSFIEANQIEELGWQAEEGIYVLANGIIDKVFKPVDENGLVEGNGKTYFLPAFSRIFKGLGQKNPYIADRDFSYNASTISFHDWAKKFNTVYIDNGNGMISMMFMIATVFSDYVFDTMASFPILFGYGAIETGKSTNARSIFQIFYGKKAKPLNLGSASLPAISRKIGRVINAPYWLDEYNRNNSPDKYEYWKGAYDRSGRALGNIKSKYSSDQMDVNSTLHITGQDMPTEDDNAGFTRVLLMQFTKVSAEFTEQEKKWFGELREIEKAGLSHLILEIVQYRSLVEDEFATVQFDVEQELKVKMQNETYIGRILQNFTILLAFHRLMQGKLSIPFTYEELETLIISKIIWQSEQVRDTNALGSFWKTVEFLIEMNAAQENEDWCIIKERQITVRENRKTTKAIVFPAETEVLYIRFQRIHPLYLEAHSKQQKEVGMPENTLKNYMKTQDYYLGSCPAVNFGGFQTSAYAFDYLKMGFTIKRKSKSTPKVEEETTDDLPF